MRRSRLLSILVLASSLIATVGVLAAPTSARQELRTISVSTFSAPLELIVMRELGFLEREGLALDFTPAPGSEPQLQGLLDQRFGIVSTSADNVVYWVEDRNADFLVFLVGASPLDQNFYVRPEIRSFADLRGTVLAVDASLSGFATVLRAILERNGLVVGQDVEFREVGNTGARTQALLNGEVAGSMLGTGQPQFINQALAGGVHMLARGSDYMPLYPAGTWTTTRRWAADNPDTLTAFIRAVLRTREWLRDPAHEAEAIALKMRVVNISEEAAREIYRGAVEDAGPLTPAGQVRGDMLQAIVDMRVETGLMAPPSPPVSKYVTPSWYALARETMAR
jgi:ABC-type nitrate/sulfonate/bicarbonate transport system substrate-binding protein